MKSTKFILTLAITLGVFLAIPALAQEKIDSFDTQIKINSDATINVTETIKYNFGSEERHGIFRYIPIKYSRGGNNYNLRISEISVLDQAGNPYTVDISYPGDNVNIKIGDADILVTGIKTYVINYKIRRAVNYFTDYDELYWNVTGNEWQVPMDKVSATLLLPENIEIDKLKKTCFSGPYGSNISCAINKPILNSADKNQANGVFFNQTFLNSYEGLTVVLGWPTGIVHKPTTEEDMKDFIDDNKGIFLFILIGIACYIFWLLKGKDPAGRGTIIAEYDAPDGLSPAEVGTIVDEKTDKKDISAEIINLAVKGYLKIKRVVAGKIIKTDVYTLIKLKDPTTLTVAHEQKLMTALFGNKSEVDLQDLHEDFYKDYQKITRDIYDLTVKNGYFPKNPDKMRNGFLIWGIIITLLLYMFLDITTTVGIISAILSVIIVIIFSRFMSQRTAKGVLAKEQIFGLKEYLSVAEKDRIKFHNAPEKNPELFEKFLPYAMVLGVETQWAGQFADIYKQPPNWYSTNENMSNFNSLALINSMHNFSSQASSTLYTAPASASSGSSGFSGGGGSGGGFGGGGGGSW